MSDTLYYGNAHLRKSVFAHSHEKGLQVVQLMKKKVTLFLDEEQHRMGLAKFSSADNKGARKFQHLLLALYERWLSGEFDAKPEARPITATESEEDAEILRIVHRPADRAEVLVAETVKHYLKLKQGDAERG